MKQRYNPKIHHRRSIRLKGYDYASAGLYFITICCQDRAHLFGKVENGKMVLNAFGKIAALEWSNTPNVRPNVALGEYIIMPNHIHGIIEIKYKVSKDTSSKVKLQFDPTDPTDPTTSKDGSQSVPTTAFKSPSQTIGAIIRGYKIATIKKIKEKIKEDISSKVKSSKDGLQSVPTVVPAVPTDDPTNKIIALDYKIWQRNYYEHIIRNEKAYQNISNYIINNPKKWDEDMFFKK